MAEADEMEHCCALLKLGPDATLEDAARNRNRLLATWLPMYASPEVWQERRARQRIDEIEHAYRVLYQHACALIGQAADARLQAPGLVRQSPLPVSVYDVWLVKGGRMVTSVLAPPSKESDTSHAPQARTHDLFPRTSDANNASDAPATVRLMGPVGMMLGAAMMLVMLCAPLPRFAATRLGARTLAIWIGAPHQGLATLSCMVGLCTTPAQKPDERGKDAP